MNWVLAAIYWTEIELNLCNPFEKTFLSENSGEFENFFLNEGITIFGQNYYIFITNLFEPKQFAFGNFAHQLNISSILTLTSRELWLSVHHFIRPLLSLQVSLFSYFYHKFSTFSKFSVLNSSLIKTRFSVEICFANWPISFSYNYPIILENKCSSWFCPKMDQFETNHDFINILTPFLVLFSLFLCVMIAIKSKLKHKKNCLRSKSFRCFLT